MVAAPHSSAVGVLSLLSEPEPIIQEHALRALSPLVPQFWAEISEHIPLMSVYTSVGVAAPFAERCVSERACTRMNR
jgi:26S proteasome regulatory subunit N2